MIRIKYKYHLLNTAGLHWKENLIKSKFEKLKKSEIKMSNIGEKKNILKIKCASISKTPLTKKQNI